MEKCPNLLPKEGHCIRTLLVLVHDDLTQHGHHVLILAHDGFSRVGLVLLVHRAHQPVEVCRKVVALPEASYNLDVAQQRKYRSQNTNLVLSMATTKHHEKMRYQPGLEHDHPEASDLLAILAPSSRTVIFIILLFIVSMATSAAVVVSPLLKHRRRLVRHAHRHHQDVCHIHNLQGVLLRFASGQHAPPHALKRRIILCFVRLLWQFPVRSIFCARS